MLDPLNKPPNPTIRTQSHCYFFFFNDTTQNLPFIEHRTSSLAKYCAWWQWHDPPQRKADPNNFEYMSTKENRCIHKSDARASATARTLTRSRLSANSWALKFALIEWRDPAKPSQQNSNVLHLHAAKFAKLIDRTIAPSPCRPRFSNFSAVSSRKFSSRNQDTICFSDASHMGNHASRETPCVLPAWAPHARREEWTESGWGNRAVALPSNKTIQSRRRYPSAARSSFQLLDLNIYFVPCCRRPSEICPSVRE